MKITDIKIIVTSPGCNYATVKVMADQRLYGIGDATVMLPGRPIQSASVASQLRLNLQKGDPLTISHSVRAFGLSEAEMRVG